MWIPVNNKYGVAIHNWHGQILHGLELDVGDSVEILEECGPWYRGTCPRKPRIVGIFPKSYIHLKDANKTDPVVAECTQVLREWSEIWKRLYVNRDAYKFTYLRKVMLSLLESRRELLGATLTQDQTLELQLKVISKIDWGNRKLSLDLVPRVGPLAVDPHKISISSLHQVHVNSSENAKANFNRGTLRRKAGKKLLSHHLYFCMRDFGHRIGDDAEIYFYLYDGSANKMRTLSERFLVRISKDGFSNYIEKLHSNCCVFTDLGAAEISPDLYLVANVMRVGKMLHSESIKKGDKGSSHQYYRRPYGVGVLSLASLVNGSMGAIDNLLEPEEKEHSFKLFQCEEKDFHQLHEMIIRKMSGKYSPLNANGPAGTYGIVVSVKLLHGELLQARQEQPLLFQGTTITRKMGFPDIIMPGDVRNDLFVVLDHGEFERGGKSTAKNIEVTVSIHDAGGHEITDCLYGASGEAVSSQYKSLILYHANSPAWNETVRLSVSIDKFPTAHVRFEFRHCSARDKSEPKLFGFSFARLMEPFGATIADGMHELYVYKCEDVAKLSNAAYLALRCSPKDEQGQLDQNSTFHRSSKECLYVRSLLISTKLTQNSDILSLLQWKTHPERINASLTRVLKLRDEELIKFLQDVLDALFAMFSNEEGNSTEHSGTVFHVLVSIFSLLQCSKFEHFKPVMDEYIENHFAAALVYKGLITSVQHLADWVTNADRSEPIQKCFDSLEYIFKLIIQSRKLFARATGGQYEDSFRRDLHTLFSSLNRMLGVPSYDVILPTQEALLNSTGVILEQLQGTLPASELGTLARNMLDAVVRESQPRLIQAKLKAVKDLVSGQLFHDEESRSVILAVACKHLRVHLARRDELRLCAEILAEILNYLHQLRNEQTESSPPTSLTHDLNALCRNILDILMQTILVIVEGSPPVLSALVAVLLGLLQQLDETHYTYLFDELSASGELKDFLHKSLLIFKELLANDWQVFPLDWLVMKLTANDILRKGLEEFAKPLVYRYLDASNFDSQLWWSYFSLAVAFLTQPCLQLEKYHDAKRRKILHEFSDMRVLMGFQILSMWSQLGEHKLNFIPSMVGPFLEVTLVPEPALRKATLTVFYDMMHCEQISRGSFRLVESELIDKLDLLISENKGDDEYRELFSTILTERVQEEKPIWMEAGSAFILSVTRLLERLLDYRSVMQGDENRDKRMSCTVNLLNFYKTEINRKEMYLRYIYKLFDLHTQAENYTEAGFTLKLYADMLSWDKETLTFAPNDNVGQPEWQRKENLYQEILKNFDKGKCWEKGIPLCKELAIFYETKRFDYNCLSHTLILEAKFFQNILTQLRLEPEYFRVGFYGMGFPLFVRNKQFVYRGLEYERIGAFTQRLQTEFPQAQILMRNTPPEGAIFTEPGQFIQISKVKPIPVQPLFQQAMVHVPEKIAQFYQVNDVTRFQHDRPVYKGQVDKDNEFKSLWIERTTLDIAQPLPGILRWFEIVDRSFHELTPVEFACETMENVAKELWELIVQYRADPGRNINPFSMRLQGIIDANVMGGISKYQEAFFTEQFGNSTEGKGQQVNVHRLKALILEQAQILDTALELHGTLAPEGVQPLHNRLMERFAQMKQSLLGIEKMKRQHSESIVNTPLPPLPIDKRAMSLCTQNEQKYNRTNDALDGDVNCNERNSNYYQLNYEQDTIYTRPSESNGNTTAQFHRCISNRDQSTHSNGDHDTAPPVPLRPKSAGYGYGYHESPEIPPKLSLKETKSMQSPSDFGSSAAPPLPPRGYTPDKRTLNSSNLSFSSNGSDSHQNDLQSAMYARRNLQKYSVVNISLDDQTEADSHQLQHIDAFGYEQPPPSEFRDSGISNTMSIRSTIAECCNVPAITENMRCVDDCIDPNANEAIGDDLEMDSPPPIPKKTMIGSLGHGLNKSMTECTVNSNDRHSLENQNDDKDDLALDGYCVPKVTSTIRAD